MAFKTVAALLSSILLTVALANPGPDGDRAQSGFWTAAELASPAGADSRSPNLYASADGQVYLTWLESPDEKRHALRFAVLEAQGWSQPRTIAEGSDWFVNWADFPSLTALSDGRLAAHWLVKNGDGLYAYDIHIALSNDAGKTWAKSVVPHNDGTPTQHGFVSLLPHNKTELLAVWLDGRLMTDPSSEVMTLRAAVLDKNGKLLEETLLDENVCTCCQTAAVATPDGALIAYRDRSETEIRDIALLRRQDGRWSQPRTLHEDGWQIAGCPVNGPSLAADGQRVAAIWFTEAADKARVLLAFSDDGGASFGEPIRIDDGDPFGRVDVVLLADGTALTSWLEAGPRGGEVRLRRVHADGSVEPSLSVVRTDSGFPQLVRLCDHVYIAWTQSGTPETVRTAVFSTSDSPDSESSCAAGAP